MKEVERVEGHLEVLVEMKEEEGRMGVEGGWKETVEGGVLEEVMVVREESEEEFQGKEVEGKEVELGEGKEEEKVGEREDSEVED